MFHPGESLRTSRNDLYTLLVHHEDATFFMRYEGSDNYEDKNIPISPGDIIVIDRSLQPKVGSIVVISQESYFHICMYSRNNLGEDDSVWGVVSYIIHKTA